MCKQFFHVMACYDPRIIKENNYSTITQEQAPSKMYNYMKVKLKICVLFSIIS